MPRAEMRLPVFLPGSERSWDQVSGVCTIEVNGDILVRLERPEDAARLVEYAQERILLGISFDYRQADEVIDRIMKQHQVECKNPDCPESGHCRGACARSFEERRDRGEPGAHQPNRST